jgi:hypothetical protein
VFVSHQEQADLLVETTVWLNKTSGGGVLVRYHQDDMLNYNGYFVGWRNASILTIESWRGSDGNVTLGSFDMTTLDCGCTTAGWNMLRVLIAGPTIAVYANPMLPDARTAEGIVPRLTVHDEQWSTGGVALMATGAAASSQCTRFDYVGVLPASVL